MTRRAEAFGRIEREIAGEKAAALGRAGERLADALDETRQVAARLAVAGSPAERERLAAEYRRARERAAAARLALVVQREAIGLRRHAVVEQQFPEPPPISRIPGDDGDAARRG
jgi:hypothetical protein